MILFLGIRKEIATKSLVLSGLLMEINIFVERNISFDDCILGIRQIQNWFFESRYNICNRGALSFKGMLPTVDTVCSHQLPNILKTVRTFRIWVIMRATRSGLFKFPTPLLTIDKTKQSCE